VLRIAVQDDAVTARPFTERVVAGADGVGTHFALHVAVFVHHFARHGGRRHVGEDHGKVEIGLGQRDAQGVRIEDFQTRHLLVEIEFVRLACFLGQVVEAHHLAFEQPAVRRGQARSNNRFHEYT